MKAKSLKCAFSLYISSDGQKYVPFEDYQLSESVAEKMTQERDKALVHITGLKAEMKRLTEENNHLREIAYPKTKDNLCPRCNGSGIVLNSMSSIAAGKPVNPMGQPCPQCNSKNKS